MFSFVLYDYMMKSLTDIPSFQIYFTAEIIMTTSLNLYINSNNIQQFYSPSINKGLVGRGILAFIGNLAQAYGIRKIPLSEGVVLKQTYPAFTGLFGALLLNESYDIIQFLLTVLNFTGVILIAKPDFLFHSSENYYNDGEGSNSVVENDDMRIIGVLVLLVCAIMMSLRTIMARIQMVGKVDPLVSIYMSVLIQSIFVPSFMASQDVIAMSMGQLLWSVFSGCFMFIGAFLMTRSLKFGSAGKISLMGYSSVLYGYLLDIFLLGSQPEKYSIMGSLLIFSCIFLQIYRNRKLQQKILMQEQLKQQQEREGIKNY